MNTQEFLKRIESSEICEAFPSEEFFSLSSLGDNLFLNVDITFSFQLSNFYELAKIEIGEEIAVKFNRIKILINKNRTRGNSIMENNFMNNYGLSVDVCVGNIEMSLTDVLSIEKGDFLISKLPVSSFVTLMIGGEVIANASFSFENDEIILKVNETFVRNDDSLSDNKVAKENN